MGRFVNPDNRGFRVALNSKIYVDKTELLEYTNSAMDTNQALICNSRPRRFGKSTTADMLTAYYSKGCDSSHMFSELAVSGAQDYERYLNKCNVIHFDVQWCMLDAGSPKAATAYINDHLIAELREEFPEVSLDSVKTAYGALSNINNATGEGFVVIIDEWDALIRDEEADEKIQEEYINFLRGMFKGSEPVKFIRLAYLTGILPIKKIKTQSALNNFAEFTMIDARIFAKYIGFTEEEVRGLCREHGINFEDVKRWYDGYLLEEYSVYNPKAVVEVLTWNKFQSYWSETGTYDAIVPLINRNFDGLKTAIIQMLAGASVEVDIRSFQNDIVSFRNKEDVLTYLIHLGYLGYNQRTRSAFIPNEEIRQKLTAATERNKWDELLEFQMESEKLLDATLDMDAEAVAAEIERIHMNYASAIQYNNENSLSSVLTIGYLSAMRYYFKPIREMPAGRGFADFVFIPKKEYAGEYPALLVELKWNKSAQTAIEQIKERKYPDSIAHYTGDILLVGINYDKKSKAHQCAIERYAKQ